MRKPLLSVITLLLLFAGSPLARGHTPPDPNLLQAEPFKDWKTLETEHFRIHHEARHSEYARRLAVIAEKVHVRLSAWLRWSPADKTEVVILDTLDMSNGAASPLPYNRFYVFMPAPVEGRLMEQRPWLEHVFTHEYVHILQLDMVFAAPEKIRQIFGRLNNLFIFMVFPQLFAPGWVAEGLAVYGESDNPYGYGRLNSAWYAAMMRMEVARGLRSLTEESYEGTYSSRWPYGQIYLYGAWFFKFVEERYGKDKLVKYVRIYGRNIIPWRMDKRAYQVFGKPAKLIWHEFQQYLRKKFSQQLAAIKKKGEMKTRTLVNKPYFNYRLTAAGNGDVYFYHDDSSSYPSVRRIRNGKVETLFDILGVQYLDWHDEKGLLISRLAICDNVKLYSDLYLWRPGMSSAERLTKCGRYQRAVWRNDGNGIAAVQLDGGDSRIVLLDAKGKKQSVVAEMGVGEAVGHLDWSPQDNALVAAVKREKSGWNLELLDVASRQWQPLTQNGDLEVRPRFTADGNAVDFLSDRDGVWNLCRLSLQTGKVETVSNTLSAISEAVAMPDGSYRLVEYTPHGLAITALEKTRPTGKRYAARESRPTRVHAVTTASDYQPAPYTQVDDYSVWHTLRPRSWFPLLGIDQDKTSFVGVAVNGADVLGFHRWAAVPLYYYELKKTGGLAAYSFYNRITFSGQRQFFVRGDKDAAIRYRDEENRIQALLNYSFNSLDSSLYLAAGAANERINREPIKGNASYAAYQDNIAGALIRYDNTEFYRRSISLVDGRRIGLTAESYDLFGKSDHKGRAYTFDWKEYIGLGANHVLKLRAIYARGDEGIKPFVLGGERDQLSELGGITGLGRRDYPLRGYPAGLSDLTGTYMGMVSAEWRYPLGIIYDGWFVPPFGIGKHHLSLFVDSGDAWNKGEKVKFKTGAGVEWSAETLIGYDLIKIDITIGYARGFDDLGEDRLYLKLGSPL